MHIGTGEYHMNSTPTRRLSAWIRFEMRPDLAVAHGEPGIVNGRSGGDEQVHAEPVPAESLLDE